LAALLVNRVSRQQRHSSTASLISLATGERRHDVTSRNEAAVTCLYLRANRRPGCTATGAQANGIKPPGTRPGLSRAAFNHPASLS